ncbi:hypothetical protein CERZMDRAFT_91563 [Cercospora zeae-maydis SCOH1-5]|uniref:Uncharacterized protein n=1 Tax=Cercospora zeae-maydis SCOH1-5 TaxID=717836 RepID=A0A6A6F5W6_9PEZI|nr:hypothetical protein CERZMDRAFT_91563 [Cercospora zeae-maydis SCOH1-5]
MNAEVVARVQQQWTCGETRTPASNTSLAWYLHHVGQFSTAAPIKPRFGLLALPTYSYIMPGPSDKWTDHSTATNESAGKKLPHAKGNNDKMVPSTVSSTTSSSRSASPTNSHHHRHMGERKASDIASWTAGVPSKSTNPNGVIYDEENPAVQAYIQLKMSLFQRHKDRSSASAPRNK